jgi:hypothetical protein
MAADTESTPPTAMAPPPARAPATVFRSAQTPAPIVFRSARPIQLAPWDSENFHLSRAGSSDI